MLVDVQVQFLGIERGVGLDEIAELDQPDLQALPGRDLLHHFTDLGMRANGHADFQFGVLRHGRRGGGESDQGGKGGQGVA